MEQADAVWQFREGRDCEGSKYAIWNLVHGSGRILAKVFCPADQDDYTYKAVFYCAVPMAIIDTTETFHFVDEDSAKAFVDGILGQFDPLAPPKGKPVAAVAPEIGVNVPQIVE